MTSLVNAAYLNELLHSFSFIAEAILIFAFGKLFFQLLNPKIKINEELVIKDNLAFSFAYTGYFIGLVIIIGAAIIGDSNGWIQDLIDIAIYSLTGMFLLNASAWISNKFITHKFDIKKEIITDKNLGTGIIEAAIFIAASLLLFGAISGESGGLEIGLITALVYWVTGMLIMIFTSRLYSKFVGYDVHAEIEKDNVAAGVAMAGVLIAIAIVVMNALLGDFEDWTTTAIEIGVQSIIGLIALPIMRVVADKILLPGRRLTDEIINQENPNVGAALIEAFAYIGSAILITWSL